MAETASRGTSDAAAVAAEPPSAAPARVLVVDDDPSLRRMLERALVAEGFDVSAAGDGARALVETERAAPDVIVLDAAMPGLDGLAVCRRLREKGLATPILILTARDAVSDRVAGFDAGADDYLVKPFALEELVARLRALRRRGVETGVVRSYADLTLELGDRRVTRRGEAIELTGREAELLALLLQEAGRAVSRERAIAEIWAGAAEPNVVDRYVTRLRRKLGEPSLIHTVRGRGFALRA